MTAGHFAISPVSRIEADGDSIGQIRIMMTLSNQSRGGAAGFCEVLR
jgi:hypothetical protein